MNEVMTDVKFCTTKYAAQLLGLSTSTVQKYCEAGLIKMYKSTGGHRRVSMDSLHEFIQKKSYSGNIKIREEEKIKVMLFENDPQVANALESYCYKSKLELQYKKSNSVFDMIIEIMLVKPELIVISLDLAEFDGYRFAKSIGKYSRLGNIQMILTSVRYHDLSDFENDFKGRFVFVQKPIHEEWLDGYFFGFQIKKYLSQSSGNGNLINKKKLMEVTKFSYEIGG